MQILTSVLGTELQADSITKFFRELTWDKLWPAIIILVVSAILIRLLTKLFGKALDRSKIEKTLHAPLKAVFRVLLWTIALLIVTGTLGVDVTAVVAILSVVSLAVSLAVQGTLSNIVSGLVILTAHPFRVGDYVDIAGTTGTVQSIGLTYTNLLTPGNQEVHVPNSQVSGSTVTNYSAAGTRRVDIRISASYGAPIETVKAALLAAAAHPEICREPVPEAHLAAYGASAMEYVLLFWAPADRYWEIYYTVLEQIKSTFDEFGIEMTYPHLHVHTDPS